MSPVHSLIPLARRPSLGRAVAAGILLQVTRGGPAGRLATFLSGIGAAVRAICFIIKRPARLAILRDGLTQGGAWLVAGEAVAGHELTFIAVTPAVPFVAHRETAVAGSVAGVLPCAR